jgi:hypothetical protein
MALRAAAGGDPTRPVSRDQSLARALVEHRARHGPGTPPPQLSGEDREWFLEVDGVIGVAHENAKALQRAASVWKELDSSEPQSLESLEALERMLLHTTQVAEALQRVNTDAKGRLEAALREQMSRREGAGLGSGILASQTSVDGKTEDADPGFGGPRTRTPLPARLVRLDDRLDGLGSRLKLLNAALDGGPIEKWDEAGAGEQVSNNNLARTKESGRLPELAGSQGLRRKRRRTPKKLRNSPLSSGPGGASGRRGQRLPKLRDRR